MIERPPGVAAAGDAWVEAHRAAIAAADDMSIAAFASRYPTPAFVETLSYDPLQAELLDRVAGAFDLDQTRRAALAQHGFVVLDRSLGGFTDSYFWAYQRDLPVMITADSLLHAWHSSYDTMLAKIEGRYLLPALERSLSDLHQRIAAAGRGAEIPAALLPALREADVFTTVALTLIRDVAIPSALGDPTLEARAAALVRVVEAGQPAQMVLGGVPQRVDFSQFVPRARYTDSRELQRYFRTMQWLGRARMRVVDHDLEGNVVLDRAALDTAVVLGHLVRSADPKTSLAALDAPLTALVGPMDGATFDDAGRWLGEAGLAAWAATSDDDARTAALTHLGERARIGAQGAVANAEGTQPIDVVAFAQRYAFDSRVMHEVTFDRLIGADGEATGRMMPSELDVMFVLGSNVAGELLADELARWQHQGRLHVLRGVAESLSEARWQEDLVHGWLDTIAALGDAAEHARLPQAMRTRAWAHRVLEAQLASWAELRRDNLLYIKPSESMMIGCEFPRAYVEPVPAFFARLEQLAGQGAALDVELRHLGIVVEGLDGHFERWRSTARRLGEIVDAQLDHRDRTPAQTSFLRQLIELEEEGYGTRIWDGWFPSLYLDRIGWEADAVVADVHTSLFDDEGNVVGQVLHVGTGAPRNLVVTIDEGDRSRAYVGPVSTFRRTVTTGLHRLTEDEWHTKVDDVPAAAWQGG